MNLLDTALEWFAVGYPVLGAGQNKHPYRKGWNRFFREEQTEAEARDEFKNGAWGIAGVLFPGCNYVHLDFDGKHARAAWKQTGIVLPETARNITQSGGEHLVFRASALLRESKIRVKRKIRLVEVDCGCVDKDGEKKPCGVDLLLNGIAILPGSPNYREDPDCPFENAVEIPDEIIKLALTKQAQEKKSGGKTGDDNGRVNRGKRKVTACSLAGSMRARGMSIKAIAVALKADNEARFDPPLDDSEIEDVLKSAEKWEHGGDEPEHLTDLGNARRLEAIHSGNVLYSKQRNKWILWTGNYWRWDETGEIFDLATTVIQSIYAEAAAHPDKEMRETLSNHAVKSEARGRIDNMLALAERRPTIRTDLERFDRNLYAFGCQDSAIDLSTGENRLPRREDFITMRSAVKYDPEATCPRWLKFIQEVTEGDGELGSFLQRCAGYSLTGDNSEQCFFLLHGTGGNGKGTFVNTLLDLMGDYAGQVKTEVLLENRFEQKDYHLAELVGKRLVAACESDMSRKLAAGLVKQATGGDVMPARRPFERPFSFRPQFKLWLSTNSRPTINDPTDAMWRRIYAIPFNAKFIKRDTAPKGHRGPFVEDGLEDKLRSEMSGILAWAVQGCLDWQKNKLKPPAIVLEATRQYREEEDTLGAFIQECCMVGPTESVPFSRIYASYASWCKENSEEPQSQKTFGSMLSGRGFPPDRTYQGRIRRGLDLKKEDNGHEDY